MQIGLLGYPNNTNKLIDKLFKQNGMAVPGYYSSKSTASTHLVKQFDSIPELINHSDILYLLDEEHAYEASMIAIRESRHLFFDSPFLLQKKQMDELFELSTETSCMIKFNQEILQKQIYQKLKDQLNPEILKFYIGINSFRNQKKIIQKYLFDVVSVTRDNIKSGIRKTYLQSIPGKNGNPLTFSLNILFDNRKAMEFLFTQITEKEYFSMHSYQNNDIINIDFKNNYATHSEFKGKHIETQEYKKVNNQNKTAIDLKEFVEELGRQTDKPIIVREENQLLLSLTSKFVSAVFDGNSL